MVVLSPFVPFLCTLWEPCARFFNRYSAFTDQKKKKSKIYVLNGYTHNLGGSQILFQYNENC